MNPNSETAAMTGQATPPAAQAPSSTPHGGFGGMAARSSAAMNPARIAIRNLDFYYGTNKALKGITEWIHSWKKKGWRTAAGQPVKNVELWKRLDELVTTSGHVIDWRWVKGHAGDPGNERADALANKGVDKVLGRATA